MNFAINCEVGFPANSELLQGEELTKGGYHPIRCMIFCQEDREASEFRCTYCKLRPWLLVSGVVAGEQALALASDLAHRPLRDY